MTPIRVLLAEDDPLDAELILRELSRAGYDPTWKRVETEADYRDQLQPGLDLILSDFMMPKFSGIRAMTLLRESGLDIPFIIVSGAIGEEQAVEAMKHGGADYLLKDRMSRLGQAVGGALAQRVARRTRLIAEQATRENASFIDDILNSLTAEVVVVDQTGNITAANEAWKRSSCESGGDERIGENYLETCARNALRFRDSDAQSAGQGIRSVMEGAAGAFTMEYPCCTSACLPAQPRWFQMRVAPMRGAKEGVVISHEEITERKRVEQTLSETEARYRTLFECAPDGILIADSQARYIDANAKMCQMLGFTRDELVGSLANDIMIPAANTNFEAGIANLKSTSKFEGELHFRRKDGSVLETESTATTMPDGSLLAMVRDITESKQAKANLRELEEQKESAFEASRLKSEFLASMSHELRTPLNAIIGFAELIIDGRPGPLNDKQKEYLGDLYGSAQHLLQLINDVLDLAKVEAGKIDLKPELFLPVKAIENVRAVVNGLANKGRVTLRCTVSEEVGLLELDAPKFKQICYNLLSNAVKFTNAGGSVVLDLTPQGADRFEIRVADTGIGIKPEDLPRLFREFEQLEGGLARRFQGTGLGLALTKKLVEAQGGSIRVESNYGRGSAFTVNLPRRAHY